MESYQQQLKEQQGKLQKASKQAQEAAAKAATQQQVCFTLCLDLLCINARWPAKALTTTAPAWA